MKKEEGKRAEAKETVSFHVLVFLIVMLSNVEPVEWCVAGWVGGGRKEKSAMTASFFAAKLKPSCPPWKAITYHRTT